MNDVHQPIIASKMPAMRRRLPFGGTPSVKMIKLERGLIQRSLLYCFEKGYFSLIRYLLQSGTGDARERDNEDRTGLMYCCFIDDDSWAQSISTILLEYGAKIEDQDRRGLNALHYAIITQRLILIRRYLSSLDFNLNQTVDIHGNTCLHYACSTGNSDVVRLILNAMKHYSIDITIKNYSGSTAYDIACQLNHDDCQNLLRNELILREHDNLSSKESNLSSVTIELLNQRRSSIPARIRPITSSTVNTNIKTVTSLPSYIPNSKNVRTQGSSTSSSNNENVVYPPPIFIDPIESRNITLKRNEILDISLVNQAKNRVDFAPLPLINQNAVVNSSSSTWRDDFSKMFGQLQTYTSSSYKNTIHPPLSNELSCELFENLYGMNGTVGHDCSNHRPLSARRIGLSQKVIHVRRNSTASIKSLHKMKK
jgi:ankyrin repeat protein